MNSDKSAIHVVIDDEFDHVSQKVTPADADRILIEDSADGFSKKYAEVGDVSGGAGGDHGALTGLGDDDHPQYLLGTLGGKGTVDVVAASGSTLTLDLADGNDHDVTLTDNCTLTLAGATNGVSCYMTTLLRQDGTGSRTVTWPGSVEWVGGSAPTLQTAADTWDLVVLVTYDGGTTWFAQHAGTGGGGTSADDDFIWKPLLDGDGAIVTDGDGDPTMGFAPA